MSPSPLSAPPQAQHMSLWVMFSPATNWSHTDLLGVSGSNAQANPMFTHDGGVMFDTSLRVTLTPPPPEKLPSNPLSKAVPPPQAQHTTPYGAPTSGINDMHSIPGAAGRSEQLDCDPGGSGRSTQTGEASGGGQGLASPWLTLPDAPGGGKVVAW
eukprot:CAMPEP_0176162856 /NCGR_PEP_ID=MMETSP0120_2-20121206/83317_1 /TAXON_ID=160619 /ORGANISM="Kryptoperidinium foliaceum, Strain CCMP 1326" /LENGTH=155 /DNA_ID=CAMNT_0017500367 /DNA_START=256 /DNA_END=720 /DNA_ORIENTATION=+